MKRRKQVSMLVTVTVNGCMTAEQARREVRTLIAHQAGYLDTVGPDYEEVVVKVASVRPAPIPTKKPGW